MNNPALKVSQKRLDSAILIVDKIGVVGERLAKEFSNDFYVLLVSSRIPTERNENISFLKFKGKIPKIPQNKYSKMFLIDDGTSITKESSFSFIEEARKLSAEFYFLGSVRNFDLKHTDELTKAYEKVKVLVFGDLFDKEFLFDHDASITRFIIDASNRKKIKVPGEGLSLSYPISFDDTVKLILRASYIKIPQKIILLFYKNPITDISLAHLFQKIDPEIKVDFSKEERDQNLFIPVGAEYAISKYDIKKRIEALNLNEAKRVVGIRKKKKKSKKNYYKMLFSFVVIIIFLFLLPLLTTYAFEALAKRQLDLAVNNIEEESFEKALRHAGNAQSFFKISENSGIFLTKELRIINQERRASDLESEIADGIAASEALQGILEGAIKLEIVTNGESIDSKEDFTKGLEILENAYSRVQKINIDTNSIIMSSSFLKNQFVLLEHITETSEVLPEVLGFDAEKTYLILFQDSNELRPGGGKITTVGRMRLKDAKLMSFEIFDTKQLDENLNVQVDPPYAVRRYLETGDFYLRDSSFNPDFVESAIAASAIYETDEEKRIDGIIGVDLFFLEYFLKKFGPVYLDEFEKNITHENIHQVSAEYEEDESEAFTTKLVEEINAEIDKGNGISTYSLIEVIGSAVMDKHMMFAFKDTNVQNVFTANKFSGSLIDNRGSGQNKVNDFFGLSEANLGNNKINYFVSRSISKKNIIEENGNLNSEVTIAFKNNSQRGSSFAKTYTNYIQLVLPEGARLQDLSIGGRIQEIIPAIANSEVFEDSRFTEPEEFEVEQRTQVNKSIFGFLVSIPPDSVETIKINYNLPFNVSTDSDTQTNYSLFIYKQPGIRGFPLNLTFDQDESFTMQPKDSYSLEVVRDEIIEVIISKK